MSIYVRPRGEERKLAGRVNEEAEEGGRRMKMKRLLVSTRNASIKDVNNSNKLLKLLGSL